jgi:predicted RND superfamily exporter protein
VDQLQAKVDSFVAGYPANKLGAASPRPLVCGGVPLISLVQRRLLDNLMSSFTVAFVSIFATIMISTRSIPAGILAMPPNVFPTLVILGSMGWLGVKVDLGSMLTVSVALGIAVDNELHFFTRFREGLERGLPRPDAIRFAFRQCSGAMVKSALICGVGLSIFIFSPFVPTARFGWLMCILLLAAMAGDMFILPAILMGPLGRWYESGVRRKQPAQPQTSALPLGRTAVLEPHVDLEVKMAEVNLSEPGT